MAKKKTQKEFEKEVHELGEGEYSVISKYVKSSYKVKIKHNICGNTYEVRPSSFLGGRRCPKCAVKRRTKTQKEFEDEVRELEGNEYKFIEDYKGSKTKIKVRHKECGRIYEVKPDMFLSGSRCPLCYKEGRKLTQKQFEGIVYKKGNNEYEVKGNYENSNVKILMLHKVCGNEFLTYPRTFKGGDKCPRCVHNRKRTTEEFKEYVKKRVGNEYEVLGEYETERVSIKMKHINCGRTYEVKPKEFKVGSRCPFCRKSNSRGERNIQEYLNHKNIRSEREKIFEDFIEKPMLRFDFYLPEYNMCIEFDGIQHYEPVEYFGGVERFGQRVENDRAKDEYCLENNINMLRIPYTELGNEWEIIEEYIKTIYKE